MNHHLNNFLDKAERKPVGSSNAGINKERKRQGYKEIHEKKEVVAKKMKKQRMASIFPPNRDGVNWN